MSDGAISHLAHEVQCVFRSIILVLPAHPDSWSTERLCVQDPALPRLLRCLIPEAQHSFSKRTTLLVSSYLLDTTSNNLCWHVLLGEIKGIGQQVCFSFFFCYLASNLRLWPFSLLFAFSVGNGSAVAGMLSDLVDWITDICGGVYENLVLLCFLSFFRIKTSAYLSPTRMLISSFQCSRGSEYLVEECQGS